MQALMRKVAFASTTLPRLAPSAYSGSPYGFGRAYQCFVSWKQNHACTIVSLGKLHRYAAKDDQEANGQAQSTHAAPSFPCLDKLEERSAVLSKQRGTTQNGPEPSYSTGAHRMFHCHEPLLLDWGGILPRFDIAYETWGKMNEKKSNVMLLHTGLSASSHAHSTPENTLPGWWEKFIGPGKPLDTEKFFIICTNVIGGCYGSTGPSSIDPSTGQQYATRFPITTLNDMVRAQFRLLDHLAIHKLYASIGSSMGGMQSLAAGVLFPDRVSRVVSISGCAKSSPSSIAIRHTQRQVLMTDPHWNRGFYYDGIGPHIGMKLARQIATITYRSGPEWEARFGRRRADPSKAPALCPDFLIETYLDHAGEKWYNQYDANSLLYVSKAMDLFDLGADYRSQINQLRQQNESKLSAFKLSSFSPSSSSSAQDDFCTLTLPTQNYEEVNSTDNESTNSSTPASSMSSPDTDLIQGMRSMSDIPTLVLGVASDILFPAWQQRAVAQTLEHAGNHTVTHIELGEDKSLYGHDTFLLDTRNIGGAVGRWLNQLGIDTPITGLGSPENSLHA